MSEAQKEETIVDKENGFDDNGETGKKTDLRIIVKNTEEFW